VSRRGRRPAPGPRAAPPRGAPALSPHGALAARFADPGAAVDPLAALGVDPGRLDLGEPVAALAQEVVACADAWAGPAERVVLALALLATQVAARQGSTRIPLAPDGPLPALLGAIAGRGDPAALAAEVTRLAGAAGLGGRGGGLIGGPGEVRPLIVDDGALYPHRLWWLETQLARQLRARLAGPRLDDPALAEAIADVRARPGAVVLTGEQAGALGVALGGRLGVVAGGPGTGKTAIVVSLVRVLARLAGDGGVALAAPTGKAAHRMGESLGHQLAAIADPADADRALIAAPPAAQTLHRLLGWRPDGGFRHSEQSPLPHAAVIVDEASMVDLALMERLSRALRPTARLILLGDAHQLPAVDAGAVLAELVGLAGARGAPWAIELTESHRMRADDPDGAAILAAARAVDAGRAERLGVTRASLADAGERGVERVVVDSAAQLGEALDTWWRRTGDDPELVRLAGHAYRRQQGAWLPADEAALAELLALHERRRLLTVTRGLATGSLAVNARLHRRMLERTRTELAPDFVPGEPVMITGNDYERGLYNGDQGVVVRVVDDDGAQRYRAVFRIAGGPRAGLTPLPIDAVRATMELAWAMTVHKSQGSELDRIALVLPLEDLPLCTRELIYTGLTRARRGALILGPDHVLYPAVARRAVRHSGLAARLERP
jgi:exodeoxyribonuclease V alpha subunit